VKKSGFCQRQLYKATLRTLTLRVKALPKQAMQSKKKSPDVSGDFDYEKALN
jgi:hypothetical protein